MANRVFGESAMTLVTSKRILNEHLLERVILIFFILMSLFLLSLSFVLGQVYIDDIEVPVSIEEGYELVASINAYSDLDEEVSYMIYYDGVLVSDTESYVVSLNHSSQGIHEMSFFVADSESNASDKRTINVIDRPLSLTMISPESRTYNTYAVTISLHTSSPADMCSYMLNGSYIGALSGSVQDFSGTVTLERDGTYILLVNCSNAIESAAVSRTFSVDTINPVILSKSYTLDDADSVTLSLTTDKVSSCKYDLAELPYDTMASAFSNTNNVQHHTSIEGLHDGSYTYFIRCMSVNGNIGNLETISFNIISRPSAEISLSKNPPLKAGTYKVVLRTSEPVISAPSLYYTFNTDTTPRYVTLTGSGRDWEGFLIVDAAIPNMVGTFRYSGVDMDNNVGDVITEGQLFLVDTTKPAAPSSLEAESSNDGTIILKWYYDGEDAKRYNIYRSDSGDPEYVDYYESTTSKQYVDDDTVNGVTYYYRIAAVDEADNDGLLSAVLGAQSSRIEIYDEEQDVLAVQKALDSRLLPKVDKLIVECRNYITDIDAVKSEMDKIDDSGKLKLISILGLSADIGKSKTMIDSVIQQASALKNQDLPESELDVRLNKLRMDAIKAKSLVPEDIIIDEQSSFDQVTQESDVDAAISEVVLVNLSRNVLKNYSVTNKRLQDDILVKTDVFIFRIKYLGKDEYDKYTLVKKVVSSGQELKDISIIEIIPKSFERKASDINFEINNQQKPMIVKEDPVLRWDVNSFSQQTIYYMINNHAEMTSAKETRMIILYRPDFKVTQTMEDTGDTDTSGQSGNGLTGFVSLDSGGLGNVSGVQWTIILGIGLIVILSTYYVSLDKKEKKRETQRLKDHRIISKAPRQPASEKPQETRKQPTSGLPPEIQVYSIEPESPGPVIKNITLPKNVNVPVILSVAQAVVQLERANACINDFDYENARNIYNVCLQAYPRLKFKNPKEKNDIGMLLNHLYMKLTAYRTIYVSRKHVASKNYNLIQKDVEIITKMYRSLYDSLEFVEEEYRDSERKFIDYVMNSKRHLQASIS